MSASNNCHFIGNLTRDAEMKYANSGTAICNFAIAVNYKKRQGDNWVDEADFFDCVLFGKRAESLNQYLLKGQPVAVAGELHIEKWEKDGQHHMKVKVTADDIRLLNKREGGGDNGGGRDRGGYGYEDNRSSHDMARGGQGGRQAPPPSRGAPPQGQRQAPPAQASGDGFEDDQIPFD